ncbi:MAG: phosphatidylinositol mannoside acyltransferase [Acidimicrobiales bacterium]
MRSNLVSLGYKAGSAVAQKAPAAVANPTRRAASKVAARISAERRFMLTRHLRRVVGDDLDSSELNRLIGRTIDAYARYWVDSAKLQAATPAEVDIGFTVEGFEHIEDAFSRGVGPILALPHLGGWEWAGRWLTCRPGYEVTAVVEAIDPPELFEWMVEYRESFGMHIVALGPNVASTVIRALKENHVVCLLCDRDIAGGGVEVEFFGEKTTLPAGPATVALRTGAAVIPVGVYQQPDRHHAICRPPVDTSRDGRLRDDIQRVTQDLAVELERLIRRRPEQWHLMGPNWPSDEVALEEFRTSKGTKA